LKSKKIRYARVIFPTTSATILSQSVVINRLMNQKGKPNIASMASYAKHA